MENENLLYLTTKQFNLTEDEAKELLFDEEGILKENAADIILEKDKERIQKFKDERTTKYNEGYQTAEKKFKNHAEETFKKLTGYNGEEVTFDEMFQKWFDVEKKKLSTKKEVTEDDIKRHPLYVDLESKSVKKEDYDKLQQSFDEFKTQEQRQKVMGVVTQRAWDVVAAKNPILSENPAVANNRRLDFLNKFSGYDYDLQDGKIIVSKDGKRLEDEHGNLKVFETFAMDLALMNFDFQAQSDKGNAGNGRNGSSGGNGGVVINEKPTTEKEYAAAFDKYSGPGDENRKMRIALTAYYNEHKKD